jgi:hypothetical protein
MDAAPGVTDPRIRRMKPQFLLFLCWVLASGTAWAQNPPAGAASPPGPALDGLPAAPREPAVQRSVIEDEGSRISELRVRGQTQRITVQPKVGGAKAYEIVTGDGHGIAGGATGQRVWQVLQF